ncbi:MAG TPA: hypothetical protein VGJ09_18605, partial [Bryobacteraceae bacterium]
HGAIASGQAAAEAIEGALRGGKAATAAFGALTRALRRDLALSSSGSRWFYGTLDMGYRALTAPVLRTAVINAYANGTKIAGLANAVRRFVHLVAAHA